MVLSLGDLVYDAYARAGALPTNQASPLTSYPGWFVPGCCDFPLSLNSTRNPCGAFTVTLYQPSPSSAIRSPGQDTERTPSPYMYANGFAQPALS